MARTGLTFGALALAGALTLAACGDDPTTSNDPTWAKLRQNLAKYNPPADVLEKLLAALTV